MRCSSAGGWPRRLALRDRLIGVPYYRLIHAEADGLPGLIVDRFGDALVVQVNTAGMDCADAGAARGARGRAVAHDHRPQERFAGARARRAAARGRGRQGRAAAPIELMENGADNSSPILSSGQKTGWFYDQRDNRRFVAGLAKDATCSMSTATAAASACWRGQGGRQVGDLHRPLGGRRSMRRSEAAPLNGVDRVVSFEKAEAFEALEKLGGDDGALRRRDLRSAGLREEPQGPQDRRAGLSQDGAARGAAGAQRRLLVRRPRCSHLVDLPLFADQVRRGLRDAGRSGRILLTSGAALDHPVHPNLPETAYLKAMTLQLD